MNTKRFKTTTYYLIGLLLLGIGCSKEIVEAEQYGSIEGMVQNSATGEGIPFTSISTNPGTDVILTDGSGQFSFTDIPTGNYTIQAEKSDFSSKSVRVSVKEARTAVAQILLEGDDAPTDSDVETEITSFFNTERGDSSFADVNFLVRNAGGSTITEYEIYFQIYTTGGSFFYEFEGDTLKEGQRHVGEFSIYTRRFSADSVTISGIYTSDS